MAFCGRPSSIENACGASSASQTFVTKASRPTWPRRSTSSMRISAQRLAGPWDPRGAGRVRLPPAGGCVVALPDRFEARAGGPRPRCGSGTAGVVRLCHRDDALVDGRRGRAAWTCGSGAGHAPRRLPRCCVAAARPGGPERRRCRPVDRPAGALPAATLHHEATTLVAEDPALAGPDPLLHHSILEPHRSRLRSRDPRTLWAERPTESTPLRSRSIQPVRSMRWSSARSSILGRLTRCRIEFALEHCGDLLPRRLGRRVLGSRSLWASTDRSVQGCA